MRNLLIVGASAIALTACQTTTTPTALKSEADVGTFKYKVSEVEHQVKNVPSWFMEPPTDDNVIYAVGSSSLPNLQLAIDVATLGAKRTLADRINSRVRSQTKTFISKIGDDGMDASVMSEINQATRNLVVDADLGGYHQDKLSIVPNGTQFRVYVMLAYSDKNARKILRNRLSRDRALLSKISATQAFQELDKDVKAVKKDEKQAVLQAVPVPKVTTQ